MTYTLAQPHLVNRVKDGKVINTLSHSEAFLSLGAPQIARLNFPLINEHSWMENNKLEIFHSTICSRGSGGLQEMNSLLVCGVWVCRLDNRYLERDFLEMLESCDFSRKGRGWETNLPRENRMMANGEKWSERSG